MQMWSVTFTAVPPFVAFSFLSASALPEAAPVQVTLTHVQRDNSVLKTFFF